MKGTTHPDYPHALPLTSTATEKEAQAILSLFGSRTYTTGEYIYSGPWNGTVDDIWAASARIENFMTTKENANATE